MQKRLPYLMAAVVVNTVVPHRAHAQNDPCASADQMTEKQKAHSRTHTEYRLGSDKSLCRLVERSATPVLVQVGGLRELPALSQTPHGYPDWFLRVFAYEADAVVVGTVKSSSSALIDDGSFIFTDVQVEVQEVVKDNLAAPISRNTEITVTRPGGTLLLKAREVRAEDTEFKPFHEGGRYVLFLHFIRESGAYRVFSERSFELTSRGVVKLTEHGIVLPESRKDNEAFVSEVRAALANTLGWGTK